MKKNSPNLNFVLKGRVVSNKDRHGIAGVTIKAVDPDSNNESEHTISNEDGGFHFRFEVKDPAATREVFLNLFDVNNKPLRGTEKAIPLKAEGEESYVELIVDDEEIQSHRASVRSIKPRDGRVFPAEKMHEIYGAINRFGNTSKRYFFGGGMRPGLTCPFPEMTDYDNLLIDAWETLQVIPPASERFRNTLDAISFSMSQRGAARSTVDFQSKDWKEFVAGIGSQNGRARTNFAGANSKPLGGLSRWLESVWNWLAGAKPGQPPQHPGDKSPVLSLESAALLTLAAARLGMKDYRLSNHYRNIVLTQLNELAAVAPIYRTARSALHGDMRSQSDLRIMMDIWGDDCPGRGPIVDLTGRVIWDPSQALEPDLEAMLRCIEAMIERVTIGGEEYRIDSLTPNDGCAGGIAVLRGSGFKPGGKVKFVGLTLNSAVTATVRRWTETEIEVVIPTDATYGPVRISYEPDLSVRVCGMALILPPRDVSESPTIFVGGMPRVDSISFLKDGEPFDHQTEPVLPGERVTLVYETTPNVRSHSVLVMGAMILDGGQLATDGQLAPEWREQNIPPFDDPGNSTRTTVEMSRNDTDTVTTRYRCVITVTNRCGPMDYSAYYVVHLPSLVALTDIEVTQAIQFLDADEHMPNEDVAEDDHSVPLIKNKRTLARVYYKTDQLDEFNQGMSVGLSVSLRGYRDGLELGSSPLTPFNSDNLFALNTTDSTVRRAKLTRSGNFLLPNSWTNPTDDARLTLVAELGIRPNAPWIRDRIDEDGGKLRLTGLRFNSAEPMRCIVVRVNFTGPGSNGGIAPGLTRCARALGAVADRYPTSDLEIYRPPNQDDWVVDFDGDLTADRGAWEALINKLGWMAFWAGHDDDKVWVGGLHPDIPLDVVGGIASSHTVGAVGLAASPMDSSRTSEGFRATMHELGHSYGMKHSNEDPDYPDYMDDGSTGIGEFGVDVAGIDTTDFSNIDGMVFKPAETDFMFTDDGNRRWFSPYTYRKLMDLYFAADARSSNTDVSNALVRPRRFGEQIFVAGFVDESGRPVLLSPLFHLPAKPARRRGKPSGYEIVLLDADRRVLHKAPIRRGRNETERLSIFESVPLIKATKYLEIHDAEQATVLDVVRDDEPPTLRDLRLEKGDGHYTLTWRSGSRSGEFWCGVQLTCDDGKNWSTLNRPEPIETYTFDPSNFGGGERCRLRVFVTDGFNTSRAETESFSLPIAPPEIHPVNFDSETEFFAGVTYELRVQPIYILSVPHRTEIRWYLNKEGVGKGRQLSINFKPSDQLLEVIPEGFDAAAIAFTLNVKEKKEPATDPDVVGL